MVTWLVRVTDVRVTAEDSAIAMCWLLGAWETARKNSVVRCLA